MSRGGQLCLRTLIIPYGFLENSSGVRQALAREIPEFKRQFPQVNINLRPRVCPTRAMTGVYSDGSHCSVDISEKSAQAIISLMHQLVHTANDEVRYFKTDTVYYERKSVQGAWNPWLFIAERPVERHPKPKWDRKLSTQEWDHYVKRYSEQWEEDARDVDKLVRTESELHGEHIKELKRRWSTHMKEKTPSDLERQAQQLKTPTPGTKTTPPTFDEYVMFSVPEMQRLGNDALCMLRTKQTKDLVEWWEKRRQQLKPP